MDDYHAIVVARLKRAYQVGVPVAFGTDVVFVKEGEDRGTLSIEFITSFVEAAVPAKLILQAMTVNAARLMGMEKERGTIASGLRRRHRRHARKPAREHRRRPARQLRDEGRAGHPERLGAGPAPGNPIPQDSWRILGVFPRNIGAPPS